MDFNKLFARVKNVLLTPKTEWPVITGESETVASLYKNYILILAAIPAVLGFIKMSVLGISLPFAGTIRVGFVAGVTNLILTYAVSLALTYLVALIVNALAPTFNAQKDQVQALKTVAYAFTASWIASVFTILPSLGGLIAIAAGIYGIYLIYLGLPNTMKCPQEKAAGYTAVSVIIAIVLSWVFAIIVATVSGVGALTSAAISGAAVQSSSTFTPDKSNVLAMIGQQAQEASKKMEAAQKSGDANAQAAAASQMVGAVLGGGSQVEALAPDALKPFVPDTLAGLPRTSLEVARNAPIGIQVSNAKATYSGQQGGPQFNLEITDAGGAKGFMALAGFGGLEEEKQTNQGYEKTYHQDGRLVHEEWNNSGSGEYTVILGDRFVVAVHGSGVANVDALKSALASLNLAGLEALKTQGVKSD